DSRRQLSEVSERGESDVESPLPEQFSLNPLLQQLEKMEMKDDERYLPFGCFDQIQIPSDHPLADEVYKITESQLDYVLNGANDPATDWTLFSSDGDMKMYTRELEQDGVPVDPLKASHTVNGVTALEFLHYFFEPRYKPDWDDWLEEYKEIENISNDLIILHQKHKTIWPVAPRESLFWTHFRRVDERRSEGAHDCYVVVGKDIEKEDVPCAPEAIRVAMTVTMLAETFVENPENLPLSQLPRSAFTCKVVYVSSVHMGGWVPTVALRYLYQAEYPKFLRTFTDYVLENVKDSKVAI
ncbi:hypothetical protein PMAYCL1PPCAC_15880, partial [Pristionchus mayeri]